MIDPTPNLPSTAPRDGSSFLARFLTDDGPAFAVARFEDGRLRRERDGQWIDLTERQTLRGWGELGPTIIGPGFHD